MREILFRGKRTDNDEWVYGWLGSLHCSNSQTKEIESVYFTEISEGFDCRLNVIVDYKTVGQYTGLTDKNGVRIFEGDICRFKRFNDVHVGKIVFNVTTASFVMWYQSIVGAYGEKATHKMLLSVCDVIEVIGNIHDNPEILKGGEDNA